METHLYITEKIYFSITLSLKSLYLFPLIDKYDIKPDGFFLKKIGFKWLFIHILYLKTK